MCAQNTSFSGVTNASRLNSPKKLQKSQFYQYTDTYFDNNLTFANLL